MRNLKKFLALVLAMMMALSLMITANASYTADSDFSDAESLTPEFREAVSVLEGLEVFEGYEDGTFKPKNNITRAEVATIVYRLATGDVKGTQANLYKDYATFSDVKADHWAAGYINYCANAEWIAGYGNGKFGPNDQVTGYQAATMILRAVGYGKNKEFTGSGWQVQAANFSRSLGLLENVDDTTYANTLNQAAPRELVAEILFQAGLINTVTWTQLYGYQPGSTVQGITGKRNGLAWQNFELNVGPWTTIDKWGRPGYYWFRNNTNNATYRVATIELEPELEFNTAWKECDVAHELDIKTYDDFYLFVNNYGYSTDKYRIESTDTVTNVGGQGRITEFYAIGDAEHPWEGLYNSTDKGDLAQRVIMIDTYLAKVTRVTERVLDRQGHVVTPAYLYLDVYDGHGVGPADKTGAFYVSGSAAKRNTTEHRLSDKDANWAYAAGDMILVRGYSDPTQGEAAAAGPAVGTLGTTGLNHYNAWNGTAVVAASQTAIEKEAFENNKLMPAGTNYAYDDLAYNHTSGNATALEVVGKAKTQKADMKQGKQTVTYWSQDKHTVDGTDYNDAMTLYLDVAGTTTGTTFAWYFDEFNNIIGIDNVPYTINYGVITSIYSSFGQGESATDGTAKAVANVLYSNGNTDTITIDRFLMSGTVGTGASDGGHGNPAGAQMTATANSADLVPVYDYTGTNVMTSTKRTSTDARAADNGYLHVAPVAAVNANGENNRNATPYFGVLRGNMFKFVASTDGNMTAIEVAGNGVNAGVYAGHGNQTVTGGTNGKLYKSLGYIDVTGVGNTATVRLDTDTKVMIRSSGTSTAVACYDMSTLPGDVTLPNNSEVDWADVDNDGRAEYVYVTGTGVGTLTYGLFYYNGGAAQWNGVEKNGTITGWLNGDPTTLTFIGETTFNVVRDSQAYAAHLFAVEMTNGVVTAVLDQSATLRTPRLLWNYGTNTTTAGSAITDFKTTFGKNGATNVFEFGAANGNPYSANTSAIYHLDTGSDVTYNPTTNVVNVGGTLYYLNLSSKVVGLGMNVTEETAILDYLNKSNTNDVTIVYEWTGVYSIVEIYVATDPNVTPSTPDGSTLTLSNTSAGTLSATLVPTFTNNSGEQLNNLTGEVYYRVAGTNNAWIKLTGLTHASLLNGSSVGTAMTAWGNGPLTVANAGGATYYEAYAVVKGVGNTSGSNYTYTSGTITFLV